MERSYAVRQSAKYRLVPLLTNFQDAISALNTLQSNFSVVDAIRRSKGALNKDSIPEMLDWCRKIGYEVCVQREMGSKKK